MAGPEKVLRCYLDTNVFNFAIAINPGQEKEDTLQFLSLCKRRSFEPFISALVLDEIEATPDNEKRLRLKSELGLCNPSVLALEEEALYLADRYIKEGIIPASARRDAIHVAIAGVNDLDVIVSWNMEHIVRHKTRVGVNSVNKLMGYKEIDIVTPKELP